jgi:hypothetical protein
MRLPVQLRKNLDYESGSSQPRYFLLIDLENVASGRTAELPVFWRPNGFHPVLKEIYFADVGGFRIEKGNLQTFAAAVQAAVESLVAHGTLPYYSIALPGNTRVPVFLFGDKLKVEYGSMRATGENISEIHQKVSKHLLQTKDIKTKDDLKVSIFLWADLRLYPSAFVLRDTRGRIWFPIFTHEVGGAMALNFDLINQPSKFFRIDEFQGLLRELTRHMESQKTGSRHELLLLDQVRDEVWTELRKLLQKEEVCLRYENRGQKCEISVYKLGDMHLAADRPRIYFAVGREVLKDVVAECLKEDGLVQSTTSVVIERRRS